SPPSSRAGKAADFSCASRATFELRPLFVCSTLTLLTESMHRRELAVCARNGHPSPGAGALRIAVTESITRTMRPRLTCGHGIWSNPPSTFPEYPDLPPRSGRLVVEWVEKDIEVPLVRCLGMGMGRVTPRR